jgi:pyrroline-5-carboxylate reductase
MGLISEKIGFIGAGMMAEALAKGFINKGVITAAQVYCHDPSTTRQEVFRAFGASPCKNGREVSTCSCLSHCTLDSFCRMLVYKKA